MDALPSDYNPPMNPLPNGKLGDPKYHLELGLRLLENAHVNQYAPDRVLACATAHLVAADALIHKGFLRPDVD